MPTFTTDWVTGHAARWLDVLAPIVGKPGAVMLEIGSWEGRSALWFLEHVLTGEGARILCVDPWEYGGQLPHVEPNFDANTAEVREAKRIVKWKMYSERLSEYAEPWREAFDAIYVDGDHSAAGAFADGARAWPLLKPGGVMIFDDYAHQGHTVAAGVDAFVSANRAHLEILDVGWQMVVRKTGPGVRARGCPMHFGLMHVGGKPCGEL